MSADDSSKPSLLRRALRAAFGRKRWLIWLAAFLLLPNAIGIALTPPPRGPAIKLAADREHFDCWVMVQDHHSSLIIEQPKGARLGPPGEERAPYLEYAWGDRDWYALDQATAWGVVNTLFLPSASVVYLEGLDDPLRDAPRSARLWHLKLDRDRYAKLLGWLEGAFARDSAGERLPMLESPRRFGGQFYPGREYYLAWYTCNTWTLQGLEQQGLASTSLGALLAGQIPGRLSPDFALVADHERKRASD